MTAAPNGLKDELRRGRPLGVVVLHSGTTPSRVVSYAEFEATWARRRGWTLLITPAGEATGGEARGPERRAG